MTLGNSTDSSTRSHPPGPRGPAMMPGSRIRDYVIHRFIASGGFGSVYEVEDSIRGRSAALKILHPELHNLGDSFVRFLREAQVLERIRHPNIIEVYDSGTSADGRAFVVMEFLSGNDLGRHVERHGALSADGALEILEPICDALAHAHTHSVIHRDIKASNVFLSEHQGRRRIVLLDFGLAKLLEDGGLDLTTSRMSIGTPSSMSPEQIRGGTVDARCDVYGLGALSFYMLTGRMPFAGKSQTVIQYMHLHGQRPRPSSLANVSAAMDEVISRAMAPEREARYADPGQFLAAFREASRPAAGRQPRRAKHTSCRAMAVYVDVRVGAASTEGAEDALMDRMDSVLEAAEQALTRQHFQIALEGSNSTLYVRPLTSEDAESRERREAALAVAELHRDLLKKLGKAPAVHVNLCMHCDTALMRDGRIIGGDLMRLERWAPEVDIEGVVGSPATFEGLELGTQPVPGHERFLRLFVPQDASDPSSLSAEESRERVLHTQMLAQLGRQVAGIVHDLRSPLTVVLGNLEVVLSKLDHGEPLEDSDRRALEDAMTAAQQLRATTSNILGASAVKSYGTERRKVSITKLVDDAIKLSRGETRRKASVEVSHGGESYVEGSPGRLIQVMVNLLVNAAQAIREYGSIFVHTNTREDGFVEISIRDTGVGMSAEVQERIFEPFFTTKDIGSGTGLGLSLVREIIADHGGVITVSSIPGTGSCFIIRLPAA